MRTMKALCFAEYGPPSVLALIDKAILEVSSGQVLVQVQASAVNPSDVKNVAGAFHASLPRVPGRDYVGTVVAGSDAWQGKEIWGSGPAFGVLQDGTHAQFVLVPIEGLSEKPSRLSVVQAATVGVPYLAAWSSLVDAAGIRRGETILITGVIGAHLWGPAGKTETDERRRTATEACLLPAVGGARKLHRHGGGYLHTR